VAEHKLRNKFSGLQFFREMNCAFRSSGLSNITNAGFC